MLAMDVNDNAGNMNARVLGCPFVGNAARGMRRPVGASLLAKNVNDDAGNLNARVD
jgi:hypothetical protein